MTEKTLKKENYNLDDVALVLVDICIQDDVAYRIVDQREITLCKDCRHKCVKGKTTQYHYCEIWKSAVDETDFCSRGERRDES